MNISIIVTDLYITGNLLNAIDMQNYFNCDMYVLDTHDYFRKSIDVINNIYRKSKFYPYKDCVNCDVLLVDYKTYLFILINGVKINTQKIIIFDCLELSLHQHRFNNNKCFFIKGSVPPDVELMTDVMFGGVDIQFLMPKVNLKMWKLKYNADEFTKKINFDIIDFPKIINNSFVYRTSETNNCDPRHIYKNAIPVKSGNILYESKNFIYQRSFCSIPIEQFGRLIFEMYYSGHSVWVVDDNLMDVDDGLSEYLKKLDSYVDQGRLFIPRIDELNMNDYDYLGKYL